MTDLTDLMPSQLSFEDLCAAYVATRYNRANAQQLIMSLPESYKDPAYKAAVERKDELVNDEDCYRSELLRRIAEQAVPGVRRIDTESSASRQHYIDTGRYLFVGELEDDEDEGCEGHYDTDEALTSGVGIGEPVYCDGTCKQ